MKEFLETKLFDINSYSLQVYQIVIVLSLFAFSFLALALIKKGLLKIQTFDKPRSISIYLIIRYFWWLIIALICIRSIGIDITVVLAGSAALLVGVGLGLQNLFNDFFSGLIILFDSTIKVDDIIEVDGLVCKVQQINIRTTTVLTREDKSIILPNSTLTGNNLINWTLGNAVSRFEIAIGVDYNSDIHQVMKILERAAKQHDKVLKSPEPHVRLTNFGNSSVDFAILFWSDDIFRVEEIKSNIRIAIFDEFKKENITIPFPQRTVHIKDKSS